MAILSTLLKPVVMLHAMAPVEALGDSNPLQKIMPRLVPGAEAALSPVLEEVFKDIDRSPGTRCVIHGDLHVGQILLDSGGDAWLLDLDDMALGDPAADLGNFSAHLATSDAQSVEAPFPAMRKWLTAVLSAYGHAGGGADAALADAYGRIALVRRALKFLEKGDAGLLNRLRRDFGT